MIGLRMLFTAGRFHATDWDHHVNEGVPEWPPAPWRVLRALVAASYRLADEATSSLLPGIVDKLSALPVYHVPPSAPAHVRHYMPTDDKPVKVLDAFMAVGGGAREPGELLMWWPDVELTSAQRAALGRLLPEIGYLGRAESWVELSVAEEIDVIPNATPSAESSGSPESRVRLLAAQTPAQLADWLSNQPAPSKKRNNSLPASVFDVLHADTAQLRRQGWSRAPGSRWVDYQLEEAPGVRPKRKSRPAMRPNGVVFELESAVLPKIEDTVIVADRMRNAVMNCCGGTVPWQISGKDASGQPREGHDHAYFLPLGKEGRIARILVWARHGFEPDTWQALQALGASKRTLYGSSGHPLHLILSGYGDSEQLRDILGEHATMLGPSTRWVSETPFVPPRFSKWRAGRILDSPRAQLERLCGMVLGPVVVVGITPHASVPESPLGWSRFTRVRPKDRGRLGARTAFGFELRFEQPVAGPICLGYGSHFGLGRFVVPRR